MFTHVFSELRRPPLLRITVIGAIIAFALLLTFDLRTTGFSVLDRTSVGGLAGMVNPAWVTALLTVNLLLAAGSGALLGLTVARAQATRRSTVACSTTAATPAIIGFATAACPGCIVPVAGLAGGTVTGFALPLLGIEFKLVSLVVVAGALLWAARIAPRSSAAV